MKRLCMRKIFNKRICIVISDLSEGISYIFSLNLKWLLAFKFFSYKEISDQNKA